MSNTKIDHPFKPLKYLRSCVQFVFDKYYTISAFIYSRWVSGHFKKTGKFFSVIYPAYIFGGQNIQIGDNFGAGPRFRVETYSAFNSKRFTPAITIGHNVKFSSDCHIGCISEIKIGNNVLFASHIFISDHFHGDISAATLNLPPLRRELVTKGPVIIEDNVWIGQGVSILSGVRIGKGAVIGANAVVTKDVPDHCVAAGIPARVIKNLQRSV